MSKPPRLWMAATAGLICGLAVRYLKPSMGHADSIGPLEMSELNDTSASNTAGPTTDARLETVLAQYASRPPGPVPPNTCSTRGEVNQLLRMLLLPVSCASIQEAAAVLNAAGELDGYFTSLPAIFSRWAAEDPDAALAAVDLIRDPGAKCLLLQETFRRYGADGVTGALSKAGEVPAGMLRAAAIRGIASALTADRIPESLLALTGGQSPRDGSFNADSLERALVRRWLKSDPRAALEFAAGQEDPAWRTQLLQNGLKDLSMQVGMSQGPDIQPDALLKLARDPRSQDGIREDLARRMGIAGPAGGRAMEILMALPTHADHQALIRRAVSMTLGDYQSPDALASQFSAAGRMEDFEAALHSTALKGNSVSLAKAAQWTARHSPAAWEGLVTDASRTIPFATAKWLTTLPSSPERDRAVAIFARVHASSDPERAAAWAESITDPAQRAAALNEVSLHAGGDVANGDGDRERDRDRDRESNGGTAAVRP